MKKRGYKDFSHAGKSYRVKRFDAFTGSFALTLMQDKLSQEAAKSSGDERAEAAPAKPQPEIPTEILQALTAQFLVRMLSRSELREIQIACLEVTDEIQTINEQPVAIPLWVNGRFGVADLEFNGHALLEITLQALAFNLSPTSPGDE